MEHRARPRQRRSGRPPASPAAVCRRRRPAEPPPRRPLHRHVWALRDDALRAGRSRPGARADVGSGRHRCAPRPGLWQRRHRGPARGVRLPRPVRSRPLHDRPLRGHPRPRQPPRRGVRLQGLRRRSSARLHRRHRHLPAAGHPDGGRRSRAGRLGLRRRPRRGARRASLGQPGRPRGGRRGRRPATHAHPPAGVERPGGVPPQRVSTVSGCRCARSPGRSSAGRRGRGSPSARR